MVSIKGRQRKGPVDCLGNGEGQLQGGDVHLSVLEFKQMLC